MDNYKYSEEYRKRYGFNEGQVHLIKTALKLYADKAKEEIEASGNMNIFHPNYFYQQATDIERQVGCWMADGDEYYKNKGE